MSIYPEIKGPPPLICPCCRTSGFLRDFPCNCTVGICTLCRKCFKHCQCAKQEKKSAADFDYIYNADGTCAGRYDCEKPGVVLAYDEFSPEAGHWFCEDCWEDFNIVPFLTIVQDKRTTIESPGEA